MALLLSPPPGKGLATTTGLFPSFYPKEKVQTNTKAFAFEFYQNLIRCS
jgi:hypothetical protein